MKFALIALTVLSSYAAQASEPACASEAVQLARVNTTEAGTLVQFLIKPSPKDYLVSYELTFENSVDARITETVAITMMKSDCSPVSIQKRF